MNTAELAETLSDILRLSPYPHHRPTVRRVILATLDAIRKLPAEITDSSASAERDFALKWYGRIDALKREIGDVL